MARASGPASLGLVLVATYYATTLAPVLVAGWRLPITLGEIVILVVLLNAVHTQFHLLAPWLEERRWFRTARRRHDFHHDADVNFMVGDHFWDRVFGTFHGVGRC